jgi:4-amino-4-deoxy-L-arabinose transferase-like glycosyltransferase
LLTVVTTIPLLLSFNIKYSWFPQGLPYVFLYFGGLLSVFVTPALLLLGFVPMIRIWLSSERSDKISLFGWNALALSAGVIAEVNFMAARNSTP